MSQKKSSHGLAEYTKEVGSCDLRNSFVSEFLFKQKDELGSAEGVEHKVFGNNTIPYSSC